MIAVFKSEDGVRVEERLSSNFWGPRETDVLGRGRRWMMLSIDVGILSRGKLGEGVVGNGGVDIRIGGSDNLRLCMYVCVWRSREVLLLPPTRSTDSYLQVTHRWSLGKQKGRRRGGIQKACPVR